MSVKSVEKTNGNAKIVLEIEKDLFQNAINQAYLKDRKNILIPGFRKGKAPRAIIEGMYGKSVFYEEAVDILFPEVYGDAIREQELKVVGSPSLTGMDVTEEGVLVLTVETALYPEVKLGEYKGIEVPRPTIRITEAEISAELDRKAQNAARIVTVDREAKTGDTVVLDFEGFVDGKPFEGGKGENHNLKLGSGQFIPGFEDALIGCKAEEDRDVNVTFPENYTPELAGKAAVFKCRIHEVKETILPELDDEFAKDVSEFDTLAELKKDIKAGLKKDREEAVNRQFENDAVQAAAANMTCEIPACMVDEQVDRHLEQFAYQLQMNGMKLEDYAKMTGGDLASMRASMRPMAETTVRSNILLSEIVVQEGITVSEEEIEEELKKVAEQYQMELDKVRESVDTAAVRADLETRKAVKLIVDQAKPVAPKKAAASEGEPAKKTASKTTKKAAGEAAPKTTKKKAAPKKTEE